MTDNLTEECQYITTHCKRLTSGTMLEQTCRTPDHKTCRVYQELEKQTEVRENYHPFSEAGQGEPLPFHKFGN